MSVSFTHLHVHSFFSFLDGAASPEDLVKAAAASGYSALALTDHDSLSGAVRFQRAAEGAGVKPLLGAELTLEGGGTVVALTEGAKGHRNLCQLMTAMKLGSDRKAPRATWDLLEAHREGLVFLTGYRESTLGQILVQRDWEAAGKHLATLAARLGRERLVLEVCRDYLPGTRLLEARLLELAQRMDLLLVAGNDVHLSAKEDFWVQDLLSAMRLGVSLEAIHPGRRLNGECDLKSPEAMAELFSDRPELLTAAGDLAGRLSSGLDLKVRLYPSFPLPDGVSPGQTLRSQVEEGALRRYGKIAPGLRARLDHELGTIEELGFSDYFLLVWDVVRFAREKGIRVAGRGSVADSVVAYCLGLTEVDAYTRRLLFERFMSRERAERPDIDLDFDYRHRDTVAAYVKATYGAERVASVATFQTFQARSLVREVGKVFGFSPGDIDRLAKRLPWVPADALEEAMAAYPELREGIEPERYRWIIRAGKALAGFPRFIGTHLGGVVVSRSPLEDVTPREMSAKGVEIVPFDKDDVEALGFVKLDLLSLRTLGALDEAFRLVPEAEAPSRKGNDPATFAQVRRGETIGVFQLESPAQRALQPRLEAHRMEDLIQAVAIIRPGPIKGDMVTPFLERKAGREEVSYPHPDLVPILEKTYGVVLFQEQVIEISRAIAGFTAGEADQLRRVMTHARSKKVMEEIGESFVQRAMKNGVTPEKAKEIFHMLEGYASYGFPEAHAAAFAQTAYQTAFMSRHHPAAFFSALLSHQPMGYYPAHTLITEARRRGVAFLPLDINKSDFPYRVEEGKIRVGLCLLKGLGEAEARRIPERRKTPYLSPGDLGRRAEVRYEGLRALVLGGAFDRIQKNRRQLLWRLGEEKDGLFAVGGTLLPDFSPWERFLRQEEVLPLAAPATVMRALRPKMRAAGLLSTKEARRGRGFARLAGLPLMPHRPPTRSGRTVVFVSLEDEEGLFDLVLFEDVYQKWGSVLFDGTYGVLVAEGIITRDRGSPAMTVRKIFRWQPPEKEKR